MNLPSKPLFCTYSKVHNSSKFFETKLGTFTSMAATSEEIKKEDTIQNGLSKIRPPFGFSYGISENSKISDHLCKDVEIRSEIYNEVDVVMKDTSVPLLNLAETSKPAINQKYDVDQQRSNIAIEHSYAVSVGEKVKKVESLAVKTLKLKLENSQMKQDIDDFKKRISKLEIGN